MNAMTRAHQIRRAAAEKFNCKVSEIHFGECLRLAHKTTDGVDMTEEKVVEKVVEKVELENSMVKFFHAEGDRVYLSDYPDSYSSAYYSKPEYAEAKKKMLAAGAIIKTV